VNSIFIRSLPFGTTVDGLKGIFGKFGEVSRASVVSTPSTVFVDHASEDELARALAQANDAAKEEKKGSFGSALLQVSRSRSRKSTNLNSMYIKGFTAGQTPNEDDIRKIFTTAPATHINIHPARCYGFVDFADPAAMTAALEAGGKGEIVLPDAGALQMEQSKGNGKKTRGPRFVRRNKKVAGANTNENAAA